MRLLKINNETCNKIAYLIAAKRYNDMPLLLSENAM